MEEKVRQLLQRLPEIELLLSAPDVAEDQKRYRQLTQEFSRLCELRDLWEAWLRFQRQIEDSRAWIISEQDPQLLELAKEEVALLENQSESTRQQIMQFLVPPDPRDDRSIILEIRAGTGGEEAALFVADCARMYLNYAVQKGWKTEVLSSAAADMGGYKEYIISISGPQVFRFMQYEGGTHRVQRVPATEAQGRIHTSAVTIAVLVEPEKEEVQISEQDLRVDTYRASGAGGQHVNKTDSAVRITHIPTGTVVACQDERSQHKNREKAMRLLAAKIAEEQQKKNEKEMSSLRAQQVGSGDRSERIRTYNFPQNRVTDHRIDLTLYKLDRMMNGDLDELTHALVAHFMKLRLEAAGY